MRNLVVPVLMVCLVTTIILSLAFRSGSPRSSRPVDMQIPLEYSCGWMVSCPSETVLKSSLNTESIGDHLIPGNKQINFWIP